MDAIISSSKLVTAYLDDTEVRLICKALAALRYSKEDLTTSELINLAGLSVEWETTTFDMNKGNLTTTEDVVRIMKKLHRIGQKKEAPKL